MKLLIRWWTYLTFPHPVYTDSVDYSAVIGFVLVGQQY